MNLLRKILPCLFWAGALAGLAQGAESPAARVILLANQDDPDSIRIAEHYAERRGVPKENIIALPMAQSELITWPEFVTTVWQPLQDELVRRKWIDAIPMTLTDRGSEKYVISGHRISYLVVCRGVPLSIANSAALTVRRPPPFDRPELRTNQGAVDSELSLLAQTNYPINGFVLNPLFHNDAPTESERAQVVKVSRLDGPTVEDALALVDHAIAAERTGLLGRAYVDVANKHPDGDRWLESDAAQLTALGFDLDVDRQPATISGDGAVRCARALLWLVRRRYHRAVHAAGISISARCNRGAHPQFSRHDAPLDHHRLVRSVCGLRGDGDRGKCFRALPGLPASSGSAAAGAGAG